MSDKTVPAYYASLSIQPIQVVDSWSLSYRLGNVLKYIARHGRKPGEDALDDLRKAQVFLEGEIMRLEHEREKGIQAIEDVAEDWEQLFLKPLRDDLRASEAPQEGRSARDALKEKAFSRNA